MFKEETLTPKDIVMELDKYIIGQLDAKRCVAIAMRNRWRRQRVIDSLKKEITPNNIILIGPTGVGKTEISRRLSTLISAPFVKVEASKFTEVGYVGRDVESMVRELLDIAIHQVNTKMMKSVDSKAQKLAVTDIVNLLVAPDNKRNSDIESIEDYKKRLDNNAINRINIRKKLLNGELDDRFVEIDLPQSSKPNFQTFGFRDNQQLEDDINSMLNNIVSQKPKKKTVTVKDALVLLKEEEAKKLVKKDIVVEKAKKLAENHGIVFIDEIDKIAVKEKNGNSDVAHAGVQRDLLPIVEGSSVSTKYGTIKTDHILFIAAGAFHESKPSDLIPELQGRFPIRVELNSLRAEDFVKILTIPKSALIKQYKALFKTENVDLTFSEDAINAIASFAFKANEKLEDIGARRLHTIMNKLLEKYLFEMPSDDLTEVHIDEEYVSTMIGDLVKNEDLSRYIL